jgi:uncharacterized repeat protein (TIGR01451 family)
VPGTGAGATVTPVSPTPDSGLFFRMASDWGSAFAGQEVNYVIAVRNTRTSGAMNNLVITSGLPENLTILEAKSARGDPKVAGNQVTFGLDALGPGEGVEIAIRVKIKDTVAVGTRIVAQAELTYAGLALPARSNLVTVLIVGNALGPAAQASTATATTTRTAGATATATGTTAPSATPLPTNTPSATAAPPTPTAVGPAGGTTPLPNTSSGVPIFGFALLGMTLMVRTVRLHRAQSRI